MPNAEQEKRLDSWKEIADHLGRDVRTVIRWEKERGLPVRRLPGGKRQSVFALTTEIDGWRLRQKETPGGGTPSATEAYANPREWPAGLYFRTDRHWPSFVWKLALSGAAAAIALLGWMVTGQRGMQKETPAPDAPPNTVHLGTPTRPLRFVRSKIETGVNTYRFVAADLNGDGVLDLVFSSAPGEVLGVLMGKGDGSFLPARLNGGCPQSDGLVVADLNRDGIPDIAAACFADNSVLILWGKGDGTFPEHTKVPVPGGPRFLAIGDINGDGWPDLIVSSFGEAALYRLMNHAARFSTALIGRFEMTVAVTAGDWDGDGVSDLVASVRENGKYRLALFRGGGDGFLRLSRVLSWEEIAKAGAVKIQVADVNGDGIPDLVISLLDGSVFVSLGTPGGEFSSPTALIDRGGSRKWRSFVLADLDLDGKPDLLITSSGDQTLALLTGRGDGTFVSGGSIPLGNLPAACIVADFNNDGLPDIVFNTYEGTILLKASDEKIAHR